MDHLPVTDVPDSVEDESLLATIADESCTTSVLAEAEKQGLVRSLLEAQERVEESFSMFPKPGCDLIEICCGRESTLTQCVLDLERASEFAKPMRPRWIWGKKPRVARSVTTDRGIGEATSASSSHGGPLFQHPPFSRGT